MAGANRDPHPTLHAVDVAAANNHLAVASWLRNIDRFVPNPADPASPPLAHALSLPLAEAMALAAALPSEPDELNARTCVALGLHPVGRTPSGLMAAAACKGWSPSAHALWPAHSRRRAAFLLRVAQRIVATRAEKGVEWGGLGLVWLHVVLPFAVARSDR